MDAAANEKDEAGSSSQPSTSNSSLQQTGGPKFKSYKLLLDPFLIKGATKLYRFDGVVPDDPTYPPVTVRDPRTTISRIWNRLEVMELPVPRFKIDANYTGKPPPVEVTITNLNDNVGKPFLCDLLQKHGGMEEVQIYYHPQSNKHLGIARVIFEMSASAKSCVGKLHNTPVMGNILNVFLDPFGKECKALYEEMITDKPPPVIVKKTDDKKAPPDVSSKGKTNYQVIPNPPQSIAPMQTPSQTPAQFQLQPPQNSGQFQLKTPIQPPSQTPVQYHLQTPNHYVLNSTGPGQYQTGSQYPGQYSIQAPVHLSTPSPYPVQQSPLRLPLPPSPMGITPSVEIPQSSSMVDGEFDDGELENGSPKMDLDTRIKMLLKSSKIGKLIGFDLDENSSSDESGDVSGGNFKKGFTIRKRKKLCISRSEIWNSDSEDGPWKKKKTSRDGSVCGSPPPSPFLDQCNKNEGRVTRNGKHANGSDLDEVSDDSGVDKSKFRHLATDTGSNHNSLQPPPSLPYHHVTMNNFYTSETNYGGQMQNQYGVFQPPPPFPNVYLQQSQQWSEHHAYQQQQIEFSQAYYGHHFQNNPYPQPQVEVPVEIQNPMSPASELRTNTERILKGVFERLLKELRLILRRDTEKKFIESMSFKIYEDWFADKLKFYKEMKENRGKENRQKEEEKLNGKLEMSITDTGSLLGMGFRANIPKLPSFKIHKKPIEPPVPVPESQTAEKSADEGDSDAEIRRKPRPTRRLSLSSSASEETSTSSESEESESEDSLSEDEEVKTTKIKEITKILDIGSVSDDELLPPKPKKNRATPKKEKEPSAVKVEPIIKAEPSPVPMDEDDSKSPETIPRPPSPDRVSPEGPYIHLHDHNYGHHPDEAPTPKIPEPPAEKMKIQAFKAILKPKVQQRPVTAPPQLPEIVKSRRPVFRKRDADEERNILTEFLSCGVDAEDIAHFKKCYETMVVDPDQNWVGRTHWVDHAITRFPERKKKPNRRIHNTGAARTEGFYKLTAAEKQRNKLQWGTITQAEYKTPGTAGAVGVTVLSHQEKNQGKSQIEKSREARSQQRRILTALGSEVTSTSDLLKFNQLKFRKKSLRFQRSTIHDWGLFAAEAIAADEMVIEYVGQTIRPNLADYRERKYESSGIGSSYLFRVDLEKIVDATKCGNLSRFINHSCAPNCYAKVITIEGEKKIVIYSKQAIAVNEEITYDYKFPYEEKKIMCLCGTPQCRGTLN